MNGDSAALHEPSRSLEVAGVAGVQAILEGVLKPQGLLTPRMGPGVCPSAGGRGAVPGRQGRPSVIANKMHAGYRGSR